MATTDLNKTIYLTGRLVKNPTDLSAAFPHGGTALGASAEAVFLPKIKTKFIFAEEFATHVEGVFAGEAALLACVIRGFDSDAISTVFPSTGVSGTDAIISGTTTGSVVASGAPIGRAGKLMSDLGFTLLFSPIDVSNKPHILIYRALPMLEESAGFPLRKIKELAIPVMFRAIPDSQNRTYMMGKRTHLSL